MKKTVILIVFSVFVFTACNTMVQHRGSELQTKNQTYLMTNDDPNQNGKNVTKVVQIPAWCSKTPKNTVFRIYACGTATSDDLSVSREMAELDAKAYLAGIIWTAVSNVSSKTVTMTNGLLTNDMRTAQTSETFDIPISGYRPIETETQIVGVSYHHFVLLEMEIGPAADLLKKSLQYTLDQRVNRCPTGFKRVNGGCTNY